MLEQFFESTFKNLHYAVMVCRLEDQYPLVYVNQSAKLLVDPLYTVENLKDRVEVNYLSEILRTPDEDLIENLVQPIISSGSISNYRMSLINLEEQAVDVSISGNLIDLQESRYIALYLTQVANDELSAMDVQNVLSSAFHLAYHTPDAEEAINRVLGYIGATVKVSRVYIFEEISQTSTANTYEWCAPGVEPAIQDLQVLDKKDYNYDVIVNGGMYITNDIRDLPENDYEILAMQGIKSLAILPLISLERPIGYIGFDDCEDYRKWSSLEIYLLDNAANIIISLMARRDYERQEKRSLQILQTISDNIDSVVYVNDLETYEVVFINHKLASEMGLKAEDIIGKKCWQIFQKSDGKPCEFCPMPILKDPEKLDADGVYVWQSQNTVTGKWYLVRDSIIKWIDGRDVHFETATEITDQKAYEEQLTRFASTDMMTGAYNREWAYKIMRELSTASRLEQSDISLVFIDLDGLKYANDTYGHDVGDAMIVDTVNAIRACIRQSDIICRWGGDEFILLLQCNMERAEEIMKKIQAKIRQINETGENVYQLSFSYGIAPFDVSPENSIDSIVTAADQLMYENKTKKRGCGAR